MMSGYNFVKRQADLAEGRKRLRSGYLIGQCSRQKFQQPWKPGYRHMHR